MKKILCLSVLCSGLAVSAHAEKLAIVIDDSSGMCGYLDAPIEKNAYKKSLQVLLQGRDVSRLDVQAYYLSNLSKAMPLGATLDKIIAATPANCPFTATTSPLHQGLDLQKIKSDAVIMVTDLLFDEGSAGSSDSRAALIQQFDQLAASQQSNSQQWFKASAGIIGVKSNFKGNYYSIQGQGKTNFSTQAIERPFYWVWLSKTDQFSSYLNQMNQVWKTVNWSAKKYMVEGVYALRLLPVTELVSSKRGLLQAPIQNSLSDPNLTAPNIYYANGQNKKTLDAILLADQSGKSPIAKECFATTQNPLMLQFYASCAKGGRNQSALFEHSSFPSALVLSYPLKNISTALQRSFSANSVEGGFNHPVDVFYRTSKKSQVLQQYQGKYPASLVFYIKDLKTSRSMVWNSPTVKEKKLQLNVTERYSENPKVIGELLPTAKQYWSDVKEPCMAQSAECKKANTSTYQFDALVNSVVTRLNANQRAANLLNQASKPAQINIVLEPNK